MNMNELLKQAQQFQQKLSSIQNELGDKTVVGTSGGGMVSATANGRGELVKLNIEPGLLAESNRQMLEDLITAAVNDGLEKARELSKGEMGKLTGGLNIPGLF